MGALAPALGAAASCAWLMARVLAYQTGFAIDTLWHGCYNAAADLALSVVLPVAKTTIYWRMNEQGRLDRQSVGGRRNQQSLGRQGDRFGPRRDHRQPSQ